MKVEHFASALTSRDAMTTAGVGASASRLPERRASADASGNGPRRDPDDVLDGWTMRRCAILVVEDDPAFAELLEYKLGRHGYAVTTAHDAREAIALLGESATLGCPFDLILSDVRLPHGLGTDFLSLDVAQGTPLILMTAFPSPELRSFVEGKGGELVEKPFTLDAITARVLARLRARLLGESTRTNES